MSRRREKMTKQRIPQRNQGCRKARKATAKARKDRRETKARQEAANERRGLAKTKRRRQEREATVDKRIVRRMGRTIAKTPR